MTLEEIKKAADLAREIDELEGKHKTLSRSDTSPRVSFSYSTRLLRPFANSFDSFTISRYEAMELLEKRLANLRAELNTMGVKT